MHTILDMQLYFFLFELIYLDIKKNFKEIHLKLLHYITVLPQRPKSIFNPPQLSKYMIPL